MEPIVDRSLERYAEEHSGELPELLERLERETRDRMKSPDMLSGRNEGQFLRLLIQMMGRSASSRWAPSPDTARS